jgi:hypothetical protein
MCLRCAERGVHVKASINHLYCCVGEEDQQFSNLLELGYVVLNKVKNFDVDLSDGIWYWCNVLIDTVRKIYLKERGIFKIVDCGKDQ